MGDPNISELYPLTLLFLDKISVVLFGEPWAFDTLGDWLLLPPNFAISYLLSNSLIFKVSLETFAPDYPSS